MVKKTKKIDNLGRIVIPKDIRNQCGLYDGCECKIEPVEEGVLIKKADTNLKKELSCLIDRYLGTEKYDDMILKLMEIKEQIESMENTKEER
mgnify:CR=1 FL=1